MRLNKDQLFKLYNEGAVFTALDTETTGLKSETERIIEIGCVQFNRDGVLKTYNTLINPMKAIPREVTAINHITDEMVQSQNIFLNCVDELSLFIEKTIIVAHNANFDIAFLNKELALCNKPHLKNDTCDTVALSLQIFPELKSHKLQDLISIFNIDPGKAHRAKDDANACMEVFLRCISKLQIYRQASLEVL